MKDVRFQKENYLNAQSPTGFTLIEFLITIGIIIILVAIGIPAFKTYQLDLQLSGTVRNLVSDLRYAQQMAVTEQVEYGIYFFPLDKKYEIIRCGLVTTTIKTVSLPEEIKTFIIDQNFVRNNNTVKYNPYGAVDVAGEIDLENTKNTTSTIEVKPSGFVEIVD